MIVRTVGHRTCSQRNNVGAVDMPVVGYICRDGIGKTVNRTGIVLGIVRIQDEIGFDHQDRLHIPIPQNPNDDPRRFGVRVIDQM
jgi:hypothetical protein